MSFVEKHLADAIVDWEHQKSPGHDYAPIGDVLAVLHPTLAETATAAWRHPRHGRRARAHDSSGVGVMATPENVEEPCPTCGGACYIADHSTGCDGRCGGACGGGGVQRCPSCTFDGRSTGKATPPENVEGPT